MRSIQLIVVLVAAVLMNGCWFKRKSTPKPQPQLPAAPAQVPRAVQTRPTPAAPKKPAKRRPTASTPQAAPPAAIPPRAAEPQSLGRILSPDERSRYLDMYERSSSAAREILSGLRMREIPTERREAIGRIQSFLDQAHEALTSDLTAAAQLAYRAEVLARDLARLLQ
jgi:hypothetical protein